MCFLQDRESLFHSHVFYYIDHEDDVNRLSLFFLKEFYGFTLINFFQSVFPSRFYLFR